MTRLAALRPERAFSEPSWGNCQLPRRWHTCSAWTLCRGSSVDLILAIPCLRNP